MEDRATANAQEPRTLIGGSNAPAKSDAAEELNPDKAKLEVRTFFESAPLLKPLAITLAEPVQYISSLWPSRIQMPCSSVECSAQESTTWAIIDSRYLVKFGCSLCEKSTVAFWVAEEVTSTVQVGKGEFVKSFSIQKIGQWPPWGPKLSNRLLKNLGAHAKLFQRGVACIREGFGIGAAAYFRRLIEEETGAILDLIEQAAELEGDKPALENVQKARESHAAADRLRLAAERVPASLRPGGSNPLAVLFGALSGAVHEETEEEALETATRILKTLVFLFEELKERMITAQEYADSIREAGNPKKSGGKP